MIRYIKKFEVIFSKNNLSGMHISAMWHSWNVYKYFCPLSVCTFSNTLASSVYTPVYTHYYVVLEIYITKQFTLVLYSVFVNFSIIYRFAFYTPTDHINK